MQARALRLYEAQSGRYMLGGGRSSRHGCGANSGGIMHKAKHIVTRRFSNTALLLVLAMVVTAFAAGPMAGAAPAEKIDVCHYDADIGLYQLINISDNAFQKHLDHGDLEPGYWFEDESLWGWQILDDCTIDHVFWLNYGYFDMTPETVLALGGNYVNDHVLDAIERGSVGTVEITEWATPEFMEYWLDFTNLVPGQIYEVWLDNNGGSTGPFELLGTFIADGSGVGMFDYKSNNGLLAEQYPGVPFDSLLTFAPGTALNYSFWLNENGKTVLKTETDLSYTTH